MLKSWRPIVALIAAMTAVPAAASAPILGPDSAACRPGAGGPAALVRVYGFKDREGQLRVQLYGGNADTFLDKGSKLKRIELPVAASGDMDVCVALPHTGEFAIAVLHDRNSNGKMNPTSDGVGFSRNPKLGLSKPDQKGAAFVARGGVQTFEVVLNYLHGLSVRPVVPVRS